jgi:hypothetical protein
MTNKHLANGQLAKSLLGDRHLAEKPLADRHMANRHVTNRHLANLKLGNGHFLKNFRLTNIWTIDISDKIETVGSLQCCPNNFSAKFYSDKSCGTKKLAGKEFLPLLVSTAISAR